MQLFSLLLTLGRADEAKKWAASAARTASSMHGKAANFFFSCNRSANLNPNPNVILAVTLAVTLTLTLTLTSF